MSPVRTTNRRTRGFSLVEAVVAMGVMAILLLGMGGALTMSMSAVDKGTDINSRAVSAASACDVVLSDLNESLSVTATSATQVSLVVPDRDGDKADETIVYRWSGGVGTPLYRSVNGVEQVLIANVERFTIDLFGRWGAASTSGAERVLASFDTAAGTTLKAAVVSGQLFSAQYLKPAFDSGVDSWTITRLRLFLARDGAPQGTLRVSIVRSVNWTPTGAVLAKLDIPEAALPTSGAWRDIAIGAGPLLPSEGVFVRLEDAGTGSAAGTVGWGSGGTPLPYNTFFTSSTNAGASWSAPSDTQEMRFVAYGTVSSH